MSQDRPLDNFDEVALRLRSLEPSGRIDRDRVMYLAGQQSAEVVRQTHQRWAWSAAIFSSAIAVGLAVMLGLRPDAAAVPSVVRPHPDDSNTRLADAHPANELIDAALPSSQLRLRRDLFTGVWVDPPANHSGPRERDVLRPRDFDILSRDGLKL